jgi:hypothetical protein
MCIAEVTSKPVWNPFSRQSAAVLTAFSRVFRLAPSTKMALAAPPSVCNA